MFYITSTSKVTLGDSIAADPVVPAVNPVILVNKLIAHTEFNPSILNTAYNKPILRNPIVLLEVASGDNIADVVKNKMSIYLDSYTTLYNVDITYIKTPNKIQLSTYLDGNSVEQSCELSEMTHRDIVDLAVSIFIEEHKYKLATNKQ